MKELTVELPEDVYTRAKRRAAQHGNTLSGEIVELVKRFGEAGNGDVDHSPRASPLERDKDSQERFRDLARQWKEATAFTSSTTEMVMHPAYQQIIGMGSAALPLIFAALRRQPDHWFWALRAITGEDPVTPDDRGKVQRMTDAWLEWAQRQGY